MSLTKGDFQQIEKIVDKRAEITEKRVTSKLEKKIETEVESLAVMTAKEFTRVYKRFDDNDKKFDNQNKELKGLKQDIMDHDFKMTEMVHKTDQFQLQERVKQLEIKANVKGV